MENDADVQGRRAAVSGPEVQAAHLLCVYAEPLVTGRRVLVLGDASSDVGARLLELGARAVHVYDGDAARARAAAARAPRGVAVHALRDGELDVRDGAFDLALVPDLAAVADAAAAMARLRRIVGPDGAALVASRNPALEPARGEAGRRPALDYYELYDVVSLQFAFVRMIGEVPFEGVTIAELGESEGTGDDEGPEVTVQTQLAGDPEAPSWYIALASQRDLRLAPYAILQLPRGALAARADEAEAGEADVETESEPDTDARTPPSARETLARAPSEPSRQAELAAAVLRADLLETQLEEQRALVRALTAERESAREEDRRAEEIAAFARELQDRIEQLEREIEKRRERAIVLEESLRAAEDTAAQHASRAAEAEQMLVERSEQVAVLMAELEQVRAAAAVAIAAVEQVAEQEEDGPEVDALAQRAEQLEVLTVALERQLVEAAGVHGEELAAVEALLRERGRVIAELERELVRRDRLVKELVANVEDHAVVAQAQAQIQPQVEGAIAASESVDVADAAPVGPTPPTDPAALARENATLRDRCDALALDIARREGELVAQAWRIEELENDRAPRGGPAPGGDANDPLARDLAAAKDEIDALRQALTQEHAARVAAESGEALARARAELAQKAALLEQLKARAQPSSE